MKFRERRRQNLRAALRWSATLLFVAAALVAATVSPLMLAWWDVAWPAAIGTAIAALLVVAVVVNTPLEAVAYVAIYTDGETLPPPPKGFGRALFQLEELSLFESADPLQTKQAPAWHDPRDALPAVDRLLGDAPRARVHLEYLRSALQELAEKRGRFYFLVTSWGGGTNARVEALRHGDMSVIAPR